MKTFYLQDSRSYLGNNMIWWSKDSRGYTTDLSQAREFTFDEAMEQHRKRETDIPWPAEYIGKRMQLSVDMQTVRRSHLRDYGIELRRPKPYERENMRCGNCGGFMGYVTSLHHICPNCGASTQVF